MPAVFVEGTAATPTLVAGQPPAVNGAAVTIREVAFAATDLNVVNQAFSAFETTTRKPHGGGQNQYRSERQYADDQEQRRHLRPLHCKWRADILPQPRDHADDQQRDGFECEPATRRERQG